MPKNKMTIDKLAIIVAKGFENTVTKDDIANMATKDDIKDLVTKNDLEDTERRLTAKIEAIDEKVDNLEEVDVRDLQRRVFGLEKDVKQLKHKHV